MHVVIWYDWEVCYELYWQKWTLQCWFRHIFHCHFLLLSSAPSCNCYWYWLQTFVITGKQALAVISLCNNKLHFIINCRYVLSFVEINVRLWDMTFFKSYISLAFRIVGNMIHLQRSCKRTVCKQKVGFWGIF